MATRLSAKLGPRAKKAVLTRAAGDVSVLIEVSHLVDCDVVEQGLKALGATMVNRLHGAHLTATLPAASLQAAAELRGISYLDAASPMRSSADL